MDCIVNTAATRLQMLGIGGFDVSPACLKNIFSRCTNLTHIGIGGTKADDDILDLISRNCSGLTNINAHELPHVSDQAVIDILRKCTRLLHVDFSRNFNLSENVENMCKQYKEEEDDWEPNHNEL